MLLSQRLVHSMFNEALARLDIRHIQPLPLNGSLVYHTGSTFYPVGTEAEEQKQEAEKKPVKPRPKRQRPADIALLPFLAPLPEALVSALDEQYPRVKDALQEVGRTQPNKKYSCTQYTPEYVDWLDRVCLQLYGLLDKRPIITTATGKDREEFARVTAEAGFTLPLDMRCTGCRRRFKIPTWRATDSTVQKSMTHVPGSTRASHCLRCRVLDWDLAGRVDSLHPARLAIVPVAASDALITTEGKAKKKRKKAVKQKQEESLPSLSSSSSSHEEE